MNVTFDRFVSGAGFNLSLLLNNGLSTAAAVNHRHQRLAAQLFRDYVKHLLLLTTTTSATATDNGPSMLGSGLDVPTTARDQNHHHHLLYNRSAFNFGSAQNHLLQLVPNQSSTLANTSETTVHNGSASYYYDCDLFDPSYDLAFEFWISGVLMNVIGVFGILGNVLSMVILSRPQMRSSINYLLIALASCDTLVILTSMLLFGIPAIYPYTGSTFAYQYYVFPNISPFVYPIAMCAQTASIYLTFTVTLERFVAVCHPLKARALCTYGRAKLYVIGCWVFAVLYNLPRFFEVEVQRHPYDAQTDIYCVAATTLRMDAEYVQIYIHWLCLIFMYILPFTTLAILNTWIYMQVRRANRERQRLSRTEKREIGLATMLLCVVLVFFMCNILAMVTNILEAFYDTINNYLVKASNLLVTINSSINFIIYVIFGEKFKRIFLLIFCKGGRKGRESPDGLIHDDSSFSNGDNRCSGRFQRHGTTTRSCSSAHRNGQSVRISGGGAGGAGRGAHRTHRAPSPGPCVYYPARESSAARSSTTYIPRSPSIRNSVDWSTRDGTTGTTNGNNGTATVATSGF